VRVDQVRRAIQRGASRNKAEVRRPLEEIKADLDAIEAEYERIHGRPLGAPERQREDSGRRRSA